MNVIEIHRGKPLKDQPDIGHNRWHPDIPPALEVEQGEEVVLPTLDALDGHLAPGSTIADFEGLGPGRIHPLTGPVYVKGAQPGDLLARISQISRVVIR